MAKKVNTKQVQITLNPNDTNSYFSRRTFERTAELYENLHLPIINGIDTGMNLRNLNNWVSVLDENRSSKRKRYNFTEFVWYKIVEQLREVGLSLQIIAELKENLFNPIQLNDVVDKLQQAKAYIKDLQVSKEQKQELLKLVASPETKHLSEKTFNMLQFLIVECLINKVPLSLAVFLDGTFIIVGKTKEHLYNEEQKNKLESETHTIVSISNILTTFLKSEIAGVVVSELGLLSFGENRLFELFSSGDFISIEVQFKDKKIKNLELSKKNSDLQKRIVDILNKDAFIDIVIRKNKNQIERIENTFKIAL